MPPNTYPYSKLTTSRNLTYSYIHISPRPHAPTPTPTPTQTPTKPYILFLHGFPSSSHDWHHQLTHFTQQGYGAIVPDLLGYGGSSKPLDVGLYGGKEMAADVVEILQHEGVVGSVLGVAHDWGSFLLSRLYNYHPTLFSSLVFIDVGYFPPGQCLTEATVRAINASLQQAAGYSIFGYFLFFLEEDAVKLMNEHGDSVQSMLHHKDADLGKRYMGAEGGTRIWLTAGMTEEPTPPYLSDEDLHRNRTLFSPPNGGYGPAINWYRSHLLGINTAADASIPAANHILHLPVLLLTSSCFITATADYATSMRPFAPELVVRAFGDEAGHWIMMEKPRETNAALEQFWELQG